MPDTHFTITIFIVLLLIASGVAMITKWVPVPYTLALVIVTIRFQPFVLISLSWISFAFAVATESKAGWQSAARKTRPCLVWQRRF